MLIRAKADMPILHNGCEYLLFMLVFKWWQRIKFGHFDFGKLHSAAIMPSA